MDTDQALLEQSRHRDRVAFGKLVDRYRNQLLAAMTQVSGCVEEAEDIVQEAFVRAFLQLDHFHGRSAFYTWLYRIARNFAVNRYRSTRRMASLSTVRLQGDTVVAKSDRPSNRIESAEQRQLVLQALNELSPQHRDVLYMREWHDLGYEAIARRLDVSVGTVKSRLHRARICFRDNLLRSSTFRR